MTAPLRRDRIGASRDGRLVFSQVREDPSVDVALVGPNRDSHVVVVTSGGCSALAMLAAGAGRVTAVDHNRAQNDLAEAVAAALSAFDHPTMLQFLGAVPAQGRRRLDLYHRLRPLLTDSARRRWDAHRRLVGGGLVHAGVTERAARPLAWAISHLVQSPSTVAALLAARDVATQQDVFDREWDNRRWRALFSLTVNRVTCAPLYRGFFANTGGAQFSEVFRAGVDHALRDVPMVDNWYLHDLLEHRFRRVCLPPHLRSGAQATIAAHRDRLRLVDGSLAALLRSLPECDVTGFCLSNVGEWLPPADFESLLHQVVRTAAPGAVVVLRNFIPRRCPIPAGLGDSLLLTPPADRAMVVDRSLVRYQTVVAQVCK